MNTAAWERQYTSPKPYRSEAQVMIEKLVPIATKLAARAGSRGITVSDVRVVAYKRGLITGGERGRDLSYLGAVMTVAGMCKSGRHRRSNLAVTHGNLQVVWVHPDYSKAPRYEDAQSPYLSEHC